MPPRERILRHDGRARGTVGSPNWHIGDARSEMWIPLELEDCDANPFIQFRRWFDEAKGEMLERDAISWRRRHPTESEHPNGPASSRRRSLVGCSPTTNPGKPRMIENPSPRSLVLRPRATGSYGGAVEKMTAAESMLLRNPGTAVNSRAPIPRAAVASREDSKLACEVR